MTRTDRVHLLVCGDCQDAVRPWQPRTWRFACDECADHHVEHHQEAFPGHVVKVLTREQSVMERIQENMR